MKRLLQINSVINWGSTGRIAEGIGQQAIVRGWESYIAYGRNNQPSKSQLIKIGNDIDIKIHGVYTRLFDRHGFGSFNATKELLIKIQKIQPDVILLHNLHGYYLNIEVLFNYLSTAGIPIFWTLHDCWAFTGHCAYFDFVECDKWKSECFCCPQKKSYPTSVLLDRSKSNYQLKKELFLSIKQMVIIPVSQWLASVCNDSFLKNYPISVIHNGIDISTFSPQLNTDIIQDKYQVNGRFMILGVAAIWDERKGLKDFIELSKRLSNDYIILLIGLSEKQIKGLPVNIHGITRTESIQELAELYSASDLYMNPTWEDNFPTTNIEALACGTPIVTYRTGGSVEAITPDTGFVVEKGDIEGLLNVTATVREKGKNNYSIACRERAVKHFNKQQRFEEYIELFNKAINNY